MRTTLLSAALAAVLVPTLAIGHIGVSSGPATANTSQEVVFTVGHGCEGLDTSEVEAPLPAGVTSVRVVPTDFGKANVTTGDAGTTVRWTRADADQLEVDTNYYKLAIRARLPNAPFTQLAFPMLQRCKAPDGGVVTEAWVAKPGEVDAGEAAPAVVLLPARRLGWNKLTVPVALSTAELGVFFADARIVWKGTSAFSTNPATTAQIAATSGVTPLSSLATNDEVWVLY